MTSTSDNPLGLRLDAALDLVGKRFSRLAGIKPEELPSQLEHSAADPRADDPVMADEPVNPLRHWRWE
jgi:hypothetical protein